MGLMRRLVGSVGGPPDMSSRQTGAGAKKELNVVAWSCGRRTWLVLVRFTEGHPGSFRREVVATLDHDRPSAAVDPP